ncbi:MAG: ABC transporter permease [Kiritimatiellae bacterium]|nr:ABC transporter permease [Kiritimatiellia bacterium]
MNQQSDRTRIPDQVRLPLSVAFGVVIQGLRIRIGRSVVTITGVTCGIAFLMSILTGQLVKMGVTDEDATRAEVGRVISFVRSDLPKLQDKSISVVGSGTLSEVETRVLETISRDFGIASLSFEQGKSPALPRKASAAVSAAASAPSASVANADVVFLMGGSDIPRQDWKPFLDGDLNRVIASTILEADASTVGIAEERFAKLARVLTEEELAKIEKNKRKERFRAIWIGVISLLVTVIGITNAMLMSVTERFREIGTMKCLGALSSFVTRMFVMEASLMGLVGGIAGAIFGALFAIIIYTFTYGANLVFSSLPMVSVLIFGLLSVAAGVVLSVVAALYPARVAASMVPATALRSTI